MAYWLGGWIEQDAENKAALIREANSLEISQARKEGQKALSKLQAQILEQREAIKHEIDEIGADLADLSDDRDTVRAELEHFVTLRDRVGFQLMDFRGKTVLIIPKGERMRLWHAPGLSELAQFNGRMYRLSK